MLKHILAMTVLGFTLAGCLKAPQHPSELRTHPMTSGKTIQVARSASTAYSTIVSRAATCMNFGVTTQMTRMGGSPGQGMNAVISNSYRTRTQSSGKIRSLIVENYNPATIGNPGWYPYMLVDVIPARGGARVTTYVSPGNGVFVRAVEAWARGDTRPCPSASI